MLVGLLTILAITLPVVDTHASGKVDRLADKLLNDGDFRVRTQAALALGASRSDKAVEPLCEGLEDGNTTVRAAAAAALGKLAKGGADCLSERLDEESNTSVKSVIRKAISRIEGGAAPTVGSSTKYYVAIGETTDKTGRSKGVDEIVRAAMVSTAGSASGYAVAPEGESKSAAKKVLKAHSQLKAFFLWPKVKKPKYSGGALTIKVEISIFTYPGKALKGAIPVKLTMPDVDEGDADAEDELIKMAAAKAFERFTQNAARLE